MGNVYPLLKVGDYLALSRIRAANKMAGGRRRAFRETPGQAKTCYIDWVDGYDCRYNQAHLSLLARGERAMGQATDVNLSCHR